MKAAEYLSNQEADAPRPSWASLGEVAAYWVRVAHALYGRRGGGLTRLPIGLHQLLIDYGEPNCLRCGWRSPLGECPSYTINWKRTWNESSGYLDRAHLLADSAG